MPPLLRLSAVFIAVVALAPPAVADPLDPIPETVSLSSEPTSHRVCTTRAGRIGFWSVDQQCADPGLNVLVVYLQHT